MYRFAFIIILARTTNSRATKTTICDCAFGLEYPKKPHHTMFYLQFSFGTRSGLFRQSHRKYYQKVHTHALLRSKLSWLSTSFGFFAANLFVPMFVLTIVLHSPIQSMILFFINALYISADLHMV